MVYVASNVRRIRLAQGMTQEDLAEASGLDPAYIARVERARTNMTIGLLGQIADGLDVEPGRLLRVAKMHAIKKGRPLKRR